MKDLFSQNVALFYSGKQKEVLLAAPGWPSAAHRCWIRHHQYETPAHTDNRLNQKLRIWYVQPHSHSVQAPVLHLRTHCLSQAAVPPITARTHHHSNKTVEEMLEIVLSIITIKLITSSSLQLCSVSPPGVLQGIRTGTNIHNDGVFRSCPQRPCLSESITQLQDGVAPTFVSPLK